MSRKSIRQTLTDFANRELDKGNVIILCASGADYRTLVTPDEVRRVFAGYQNQGFEFGDQGWLNSATAILAGAAMGRTVVTLSVQQNRVCNQISSVEEAVTLINQWADKWDESATKGWGEGNDVHSLKVRESRRKVAAKLREIASTALVTA